ncbi:MAG: dTDP-4-dehydrorhamnose 3,5-epimerase [Anaerolineales bacterium]
MKVSATSLPEVLVIEPEVHTDERGFFVETYQQRRYEEAGIPQRFVQDNHSGSRQGALRGLHYQIRHAQGKLVHAVVGEVYDVAVDLRNDSSTFGRWVGLQISAKDRTQIWIPPGFAHGFYVLSEWAEVAYKVTDYYSPEWDRTLIWDDSQVGIAWPLINGRPPSLSAKDAQGKRLEQLELFE